jgi:hypothetical protein
MDGPVSQEANAKPTEHADQLAPHSRQKNYRLESLPDFPHVISWETWASSTTTEWSWASVSDSRQSVRSRKALKYCSAVNDLNCVSSSKFVGESVIVQNEARQPIQQFLATRVR